LNSIFLENLHTNGMYIFCKITIIGDPATCRLKKGLPTKHILCFFEAASTWDGVSISWFVSKPQMISLLDGSQCKAMMTALKTEVTAFAAVRRAKKTA